MLSTSSQRSRVYALKILSLRWYVASSLAMSAAISSPMKRLLSAMAALVYENIASIKPAADWWRAFGDEQLDRLVTQALEGNPTLKVAQARLARAQAVTEVANAATRPQVNGSFDSTRQRFTENGLYPPPIAGSIITTSTLQLNGSWELDFFGKNSAALASALNTVQAAQADRAQIADDIIP